VAAQEILYEVTVDRISPAKTEITADRQQPARSSEAGDWTRPQQSPVTTVSVGPDGFGQEPAGDPAGNAGWVFHSGQRHRQGAGKAEGELGHRAADGGLISTKG
jgi:hypothetical protein